MTEYSIVDADNAILATLVMEKVPTSPVALAPGGEEIVMWVEKGVLSLEGRENKRGITETEIIVPPTDLLWGLAFVDACEERGWKIVEGHPDPTPELKELGGPGSGFFHHRGRPGEIGGSTSEGQDPLGRLPGEIPIKKKKAPKAAPVPLESKQKAYDEVKAGGTFKATSAKYGLTQGQLAGYVWKIDQQKKKEEEVASDIESLKKVVKAADVPKPPPPAVPKIQKSWAAMTPQEKMDAAVAAGYVWKPKPESKSGNYAWYNKQGEQVSGYGQPDQASTQIANLNYGAGLDTPEPTPTTSATTTGEWPISDAVERSMSENYLASMQKYNKSWANALPSSQYEALASYTSTSGGINGALRTGNKKAYAGTIQNIEASIASSPTPPPPDLVWRGINNATVAASFANLKIGDVFPMGGFQSTSIKPSFAYNWAHGKLVLEIKPKRGAFVEINRGHSKITNIPGECEYILDHSKNYRVRGVAYVKMKGVSKPARVLQLEQLD